MLKILIEALVLKTTTSNFYGIFWNFKCQKIVWLKFAVLKLQENKCHSCGNFQLAFNYLNCFLFLFCVKKSKLKKAVKTAWRSGKLFNEMLFFWVCVLYMTFLHFCWFRFVNFFVWRLNGEKGQEEWHNNWGF